MMTNCMIVCDYFLELHSPAGYKHALRIHLVGIDLSVKFEPQTSHFCQFALLTDSAES